MGPPIYALGEPAPGATYSMVFDECIAEGKTDHLIPFLDEVLPSAMAGADLRVRGGGRVRSQWRRLDSGEEVLAGWWDDALDTACLLRPLEDGKTVCLPSARLRLAGQDFVPRDRYFSDNGCTTEVNVAAGDESCGESRVASETIVECPERRFYEVTGPITGDLYRVRGDERCRLVPDEERAAMKLVGAPIDLGGLERPTYRPDGAGGFSLPGPVGEGAFAPGLTTPHP